MTNSLIGNVRRYPEQKTLFYSNEILRVSWEFDGGLDSCDVSIRPADNLALLVTNVIPYPKCIKKFQELYFTSSAANNTLKLDGKTEYVVQVKGMYNEIESTKFR